VVPTSVSHFIEGRSELPRMADVHPPAASR
jgi:hypothetical protein